MASAISKSKNPIKLLYWVGLPLAFLILLSAIFLANEVKNREITHIQEQLQDAGKVIVLPMRSAMELYLSGIVRMGKRWQELGGTPDNFWRMDAEAYLKDTGVFEAIDYIDKDLIIQKIVPAEFQSLVGKNLKDVPGRAQVFDSLKSNQPVISPIFDLIQGKKGFLFVVRVTKNNNPDGFLAGVVSVDKFFNRVLTPSMLHDYNVAIYQGSTPVLLVGDVAHAKYKHQEILRLYNLKWIINIAPTDTMLRNTISLLPYYILGVGVFLAILLILTFLYYDRMHVTSIRLERAKHEAEKASRHLATILEKVNEGFISHDQEGLVSYINPYAEKILKWKKEEVIGKNVYNLFIPERFRSLHLFEVKKLTQGLDSDFLNKEIEFIAQDKTGKEFPVEVIIIPIYEETEFTFHSFIRDISKRKKEEMELNRSVAIIEASDDAIVSHDLEGKILTWNKGAEELYGFTREEMVGHSIAAVYTPEKRKDLQIILQKIKEGAHIHYHDVNRLRKDGSLIPVSVLLTPIKSAKGKVIAVASITRDVSERKKIEKMKNEFISIVSHELRTPLTSIRGSLGLLASGKVGEISEKAHQLLEIAVNNSDRLIRLINDILDIEKIEAGRLEFKFRLISLGKLIRDSISTMQGLAEKHKITIKENIEADVEIYGDYDRLIQVTTNLISNAIRYSPAHSEVEVGLQALIQKARIYVTDQGQGIPYEFQNKIFGKFSQADSSSTRKIGGSGLGLSISKAIVEKHNGTISFITNQGKGSTFYYELPTVSMENIEITPHDEIHRVLICDSDLDSATHLQELLQNKNIQSDIVSDIHQAEMCLANNNYSLITFDVLLSNRKGITFINHLRSNPTTRNIPILVTSFKGDPRRKEITGDGFQVINWLEKPITEPQFIELRDYINTKFIHTTPNILCVEDDADIVKLINILLGNKAKLWSAHTLIKARRLISEQVFDLIILDLNMPDGNGSELLPCVNFITKKLIPVVVFSVDKLEKEYLHYVKESLLKSVTSNDQLLHAILSSIESKDKV